MSVTTRYDRPNSYIGKSVPRPNAVRLLHGRGRYVDDKVLPRMLHAAFLRSPHAHARILRIDAAAARSMPGVVAVFDGNDIAQVMTPWVGVLTHLSGMRSPPQPALARDVARWQGEPVVMVVAHSRAAAEDALERIEVEYEPLVPVCDMQAALAPEAPRIHPELDSNLCWERKIEVGDVDAAFAAQGATVVERSFTFGRHTGVTLEPRAVIADYDPAEDRLTMHYSGQAPHMMQAVIARHLNMPEARVRVVAQDVGGSFGIKIHTYGDEMATLAASKLLRRPVKFVADRLESFQSDIHARDHRITARAAIDGEGRLTAVEIDDITGIGPYSVYPRSSGIEGNQVINLTGAPYDLPAYRARLRVVFQNKVPMCQYRAVGHPIAMAVMEGLMDEMAAASGRDPAELRRLNLRADDSYPSASPQGMRFADLSHQACLEKLLDLMDYKTLRAECDRLRQQGVYRGIGLVSMVEVTNPSPMFYGVGGAPIAAQDGASVRLDASGAVHVSNSITEQGQGTEAILAQIAAEVMGVDISTVHVVTGDTAVVPYGGGTWASRGAGIGGEAMYQAARALRQQILATAAAILQTRPEKLDLCEGQVVDADSLEPRIPLSDLARMVYYRGNELPEGLQPELIASRHFKVSDYPFVFTNGAMASYVEVDPETGMVKLLGHWVVEDVGTILNEKLVDEQIRGGVVQGIGGALFEECLYSQDGQLLNATMADYLVPMASEMLDIHIAHVVTPTRTSELGAKGAGEAGTAGAPGAVMNAVNDALRPLGAHMAQMPMTPERILRALGRV
ncbi:xanthine dehydrogenase family protein molybdopterin-binding subunit [Alkalilacustris brevis]|uniref:xanthine dehydrogenase family protein molybdopterin-binding subunit n=1 Tax=Alkalilacustris brevis TaxID=2026338 RepID=UPI000E0D3B5B|nr:xanthine dehydrogenase family protein molybdopterin-binding subunit [Alkalilacustris brevis]